MIGETGMSNASDFVIENGVLMNYTGPGGDVVIPEGVTSIGSYAFHYCSDMKSVTIPDSVVCICENAFCGCKGLTSVTIPDNVTGIADYAFFGCSRLKSVKIPEGVTSIGDSAFAFCGSLRSVMIPDSVTGIGDSAFFGCGSLKSVKVPDSVTSIDDSAFSCCSGLRSVKIPSGVTSISQSVFSHCSSLASVILPDGITDIGPFAFSECSSLRSVTLPKGLRSIGEKAFSDCFNLKSLEIRSDIKLPAEAFEETTLERVTICNPEKLPVDLKPIAAITYAEDPAESGSEREKKHLKYIRSNAVTLVGEALSHPALLSLMCEKRLLTPETAELYFTSAQKQGMTDAIAYLLDYQQNRLTAGEKKKAAQKEKMITDFIFSVGALEQLQGKVFVVMGKLKTFTREEFKACLDACGAILSDTLNEQTDYLITNTPGSGSAKNRKAEQLGIKKLSEEEFNRLIGRE